MSEQLEYEKLQSELKVFWKLCVNLCLGKWLIPSCIVACSFVAIGLWQLKIVFAVGLTNLKIFDLSILNVSVLQISCGLFHWIKIDGKCEFFKKLMIRAIMGDIVFISSSILTYRSWDYIKKNISRISFYIFLKKVFYIKLFAERALT